MYATAVGLVLAGFRSLDEREDRYKEARELVRVTNKHAKKPVSSRNFFNEISNKNKEFTD
jgi:cell division protein FtsA